MDGVEALIILMIAKLKMFNFSSIFQDIELFVLL